MTKIIASSDEDKIAIPAQLMALLHLREGDEVKAIVEGERLRLTRLDTFLSLRGALAEDEDFDRAIEQFNQSWKEWESLTSA
jgi:antitoxin component of MazEF toxin-antitoxin module